MQTGDVPRSAPTLRTSRAEQHDTNGSVETLANAAVTIAQDNVVRTLLGLTLTIGAGATFAGWTPAVTMLAAAACAAIALVALASTLSELRGGEDLWGELPRTGDPAEASLADLEEAALAGSDVSRASWEDLAAGRLARAEGVPPVGTAEAPVVVLVVRMIHPDEPTIVALSRVHEWSPVRLFPIRTDRFDERAFLTDDPALASTPQALIAHLAALSPGVLDNLRIGAALTPDDGAPDHARAVAGHAATMARTAEVRWHDETSMHLFARGGLQVGELREALNHGEIVTRFQPIYDCRSGVVLGAELLVQWDHPEVGPLSPGRFLPRFQRMPEFSALTQGVFATACRKVTGWEAKHGRRFQVVVNAGVRDLCAPATFGVVAHLLHHVGEGHVWVDVEIDELLKVDDAERAMLVAHAEVGLELVATGLRSEAQLAELEGLPVVGVKLDVHQLSRRGWGEVTRLAHAARLGGFEVHAVRVGDPESLDRVLAIDTISFVQGYALSAPVDEATMDRIAAHRVPARVEPAAAFDR
jgi:EAL domain-containing protein (putative c-di-GMP-specific phosphodiesterase class I)